MEKFWAVILIFVVVAAAGLMYVNQVYNPQKETQVAMAEMANSTLTAVKLEIGDDNIILEGSRVADFVEDCLNDYPDINVSLNGEEYGGSRFENLSQYYIRVVRNEDDDIIEIRITEID